MNSFLRVIVFNVRDYPYVTRIFAQWIGRILTDLGTFVVLLAGILSAAPARGLG